MASLADTTFQANAEYEQKKVYAKEDMAGLSEKKSHDSSTLAGTTEAHRSTWDPTYPTEEQKRTLRRMPGGINAKIFTIGKPRHLKEEAIRF